MASRHARPVASAQRARARRRPSPRPTRPGGACACGLLPRATASSAWWPASWALGQVSPRSASASRPAAGERYLGFGERSNAVDQRGRGRGELRGRGPLPAGRARRSLGAVVPPPGFQPRDDATYFPMPWLLSTRGYGVLVDNTETSYFRLTTDSPSAWSVEVRGAPPNQQPGAPAPRELALRVFAGPTPADVLRRFTAATGRQPKPAAPWYFGPWFQPSGRRERAWSRKLRRRRRAAVGGPDLPPLPALRRPAGPPTRAARAHGRASTPRGWP